MKFYRILLLSLFMAFSLNNTVQATWSFSNIFNIESIQKKIENTFTTKWHYAAAGLFLIPAFFSARAILTKYWPKKEIDDKEAPTNSVPSILENIANPNPAPKQTDQSFDNQKPKQEFKATVPTITVTPSVKEPEIPTTIIEMPIISPESLTISDAKIQNKQPIIPIKDGKQEEELTSKNSLEISEIVIPNYIESGKNFFYQIKQGKLQAPKTKDEHLEVIVSLLHYFYDRAETKGQTFKQGSFIIEDPDHKIFNVMYNCVKQLYGQEDLESENATPQFTSAYPRQSSHLEKYYKNTKKMKHESGLFTTYEVKNPEYTHYGIDIYNHENLPVEGMHHILFGKLNDNYTFIRMEDHGLQTTDFVLHTFGFIGSLSRKFAPTYFGSDDEPTMRKERVPTDELEAFKNLINEINPENKTELIKNAEGLGISFMITSLENIILTSNENEWNQKAQEFINKLQKDYDHTDVRIGREVILKQVDFK